MSIRPVASLALLTSLALALLAAPVHARPDAVTLLPSGASSIHLIVEAPEPALAAAPGDASLTTLAMEDYDLEGAPGAPGIPVRVVLVAVPPSGEVRVSAGGLDRTVREDVTLAPIPADADGQARSGGTWRDTRAYARAGSTAPARARLLDVGWMRNQRVARIAVYPVDYDPAARRLAWVRRVDVMVEVTPGAPTVRPAEAQDPFEDVYRASVANYEQGRAWRRPDASALGTAQRGELIRDAALALPDTTGVYAGRRWVKFQIPHTGFYKVEFGQLRNSALFGGATDVRLDSLRLFTWPGFPVMPEKSYCDTCDYREVAIQFVESSVNGLFDKNDEYLYFFALGASDWADLFDPSYGDTVFLDHPYETKNCYLLTVATADAPVGGTPSRIGTAAGTVTGAGTTPATFPARVHYEQDYEYQPHASPFIGFPQRSDLFWEKWYWNVLDVGKNFIPGDPAIDAPGADVGQPFRVFSRVWGIASSDLCAFGTPGHLLDVRFNGQSFNRLGWNTSVARIVDTTLATGLLRAGNVIEYAIPSPAGSCDRVDRIGVAWVQLHYRRVFEADGDSLVFDSEPGGGDWIFRVDSLRSVPRVFDVTDPLAPFEITDLTVESVPVPGRLRVSFERSETGQRRYRVVTDANIARMATADLGDVKVPQVSNPNLRSSLQSADHVIIYYDDFRAAAESLATWRRTRLPVDDAGPFDVVTIPVSTLYDQFSGGRTDPAALRNFLRAAFYNWAKRPRFVTLLGDASYDFKNLRGLSPAGQPGCLVPTYENGFDASPGLLRQYASDDWIMNVDNAAQVIPDFYAGRIPADDAASALAYVRKLLAYERAAPLGDWRNRVLFVADDDRKPGGDFLLWTHLRQTAELDNGGTPAHLDRRYVYLHKYPDGPGDTKPGARADIFKYVDEGAVLFNFVGHGSAFKISDEAVFLYSDPGSLKNGEKLTVLVSASCDVGKFDDPGLQGLGERMCINPVGGAVGVVSATEEAFSSQNETLNKTIYRQLFARDTLAGTGQYHVGLSEALLKAKQGSTNSQKYQLMGDAGVRLDLAQRWVRVSLFDSLGTTPIHELQRGQTVTVRGQVVASPKSDAPAVAYDGIADLLIEDAAPVERAPDCHDLPGCTDRPYYFYYAGAIFRGDVSVKAGTFESRFVVPLEARTGTRGRVRAYVQGRAVGEGFSSDGTGSDSMPVTPGVSVRDDAEGPRISLAFAGGSLSVRRDATLQVDLFDPSGILTTGHSPQNGIIVTLDDNSTLRTDITSSFRYAADSYTSGTASYQLPNLSAGAHTIKVSAADNLAVGLAAGQHRSSATIAFEVVDTPPLNVARTYLFPNPARSGPGGGGMFVVDAPGDSINVLMRVYTVSGKLIRVLESPGGRGQVQIPWDGLDAEGDALANGVYLYKVYVYAREADGSSSARQRAISEGRFVIVGH